MWLLFALLSSALLGCYDILKKASLRGNAFIPVLFVATGTGALLFSVVLLLSRCGAVEPGTLFYVPEISAHEHLLYFIKAVIVGSSWIFAYKALSQLPITIVAPIRSTGPVWTVAGAFFIYSERFNGWQWLGFVIVIFSYCHAARLHIVTVRQIPSRPLRPNGRTNLVLNLYGRFYAASADVLAAQTHIAADVQLARDNSNDWHHPVGGRFYVLLRPFAPRGVAWRGIGHQTE